MQTQIMKLALALYAKTKPTADEYTEFIFNKNNSKLETSDKLKSSRSTTESQLAIATVAKYILKKKFIPPPSATEAVVNSATYNVSFMKPILEGINGPKYLDIGGGNGHKSTAIGNLVHAKSPIDVLNIDAYASSKQICHIQYDGIHLPESMIGVYDFITCFQVIHHVNDQSTFIESVIKKAMSLNGHLLIREHDCQTVEFADILNFVHWIYEVSLEEKAKIESMISADEIFKTIMTSLTSLYGGQSLKYLSQKDLESLLVTHGFELIHRGNPAGNQKIYESLFKLK